MRVLFLLKILILINILRMSRLSGHHIGENFPIPKNRLMWAICLHMRVAHVRRHDVVTYDTGVKPPKPGVSR